MKPDKKKKNGFTLIELIIVISIIGILVLLATPKFLDNTQEAKLAQIKHDIKVVETVLDEYLIVNDSLPDTLQEFDYSTALTEDRVYGKTGLITNLTGTYVDVTDMDEVKAINSKLKGKFIANDKGEAYYISDEKIISREDIGENEDKIDGYPKVFPVGDVTFVLSENSVYVAGSNNYGQLGLGENVSEINNMVENEALKNKEIVEVIGSQFYTYAISKTGDVYVFGANFTGQLALGDTANRNAPIKNETLSNFSSKNIKTGYLHGLLVEHGKLYAWGAGFGPSVNEVAFFSDLTVKNAYAGQFQSFITTTDNKLYVWGENGEGELGLGDLADEYVYVPTELTFFRGVPIKDIKTNETSTFVLTEDGRLYSFGANNYGQLGLGHYDNKNTPQLVNVDNKPVDKIITGDYSTIAITTDGCIYGWGWNDSFELSHFQKKIFTPKRLYNIEALNPIDIKMGKDHIAMKTQNGDIYLWGNNFYGQLGFGSEQLFWTGPVKLDLSFLPEYVSQNNNSNKTVYIPEEWLNTDYPKFDVSGFSTFFLDENSVYVAGANFNGQLGLGNDIPNIIDPTLNDFLENKDIVKILGFFPHTYAISRNGDVYSFGANYAGQLGLSWYSNKFGSGNNELIPIKNETLSNFKSKDIKIGFEHNLLVEDGKLYVWGENYSGQLGLGSFKYDVATPNIIEYFLNNNITIKAAYAGHYNSFATTTDNKLYVWGKNDSGELGLGDNTNRNTPTELESFNGIIIKDIKTLANSTFVLTEDGELYGFGYNQEGQLGLNDTTNRNTPQLINVDNKPIEKIITGWDSIIAITEDGSIYGWGENLGGELGVVSQNIAKPERLYNIEVLNPTDIRMGTAHTVIKSQTGDIYVLGLNNYGQLGLGHTNSVSLPTKLNLSFIQ